MTSTIELQGTLDEMIQYLKPFSPLISCHMVNYITDGHWTHFIPEGIQNEIRTQENIEEAIHIFWHSDTASQEKLSKFSNFIRFIEEGNKFSYDGLTHTWTDVVCFRDILNELGCSVDAVDCLKIKEFMSAKKNHEVEETAKLVSTLCTFRQRNDDCLFVIEAGDGKGYLSSRLALEYKLKVLGIDASPTNTENALKRNTRLEKAWSGLTKRADDIQNGIVPPRKGRRKIESSKTHNMAALMENYKTTTHYITPQTDFIQLCDQHFPREVSGGPTGFCLSGLHTCGNLASSCLRIFKENKDLNVLCNVGCCYHLLVEEFCVDEFFENRKVREMATDSGFPMSNYLREKEFKLGRNARMLAAQSIHRTKQERELPQVSLFYRALLETLVIDNYPEYENRIQVGRSKNANATNFVDYVRNMCKKSELNFDQISDEELLSSEKLHDHHRHQINIFYLLRMTFAPVIETLILLDRLLYLRENNFPKSFLVKLFDPVVSPRCFGIVALKP